MRVTDLLNILFFSDTAGDENYLELLEPDTITSQNAPRVFFRKSAIELVATSDVNAGRGTGAESNHKDYYPFVRKIPTRVTIALPSYTVTGGICCADDQSLLAAINGYRDFLPLTTALITSVSGYREERPFVAVNRHQIISLREDPNSR